MDGSFDIYRTRAGYEAVANAVQRQILDLLRQRERQLPELVELTGRSKPTLSSLHMKALLGCGLIEEAVHPSDSRRKVYRLAAQRIGSSDLPVAGLRDAVQAYAAQSMGPGMPVVDAFEAIAAAPAKTDAATIWAQAERLGALCAMQLKPANVAEVWKRGAALLEQQGVARVKRLDVAKAAAELAPSDRLGRHPATLLGAWLQGLGAGLLPGPVRATARRDGTVRLQG